MNRKRSREKMIKKFEKKFSDLISKNGFKREEYSNAIRSVSFSNWYGLGKKIYRARIKTPSTINEVFEKVLENMERYKSIDEEVF